MVYDKFARGKRIDPIQEDIVSKKDNLNERVKNIINLWIDTKRSWNGKPAPSIGVTEPHSITQPLPNETMSAADELLTQTQQAINELNQINLEQSSYADARVVKANLHSLGSNSLSRFVSHIKAPFQSNNYKWQRLRILRSSAAFTKHLEELSEYVLTDSPTAVPNAIYKARDLYYIYNESIADPIIDILKNNLDKNKPIDDSDVEKHDENVQQNTSPSFNDGGLLSEDELSSQESVQVDNFEMSYQEIQDGIKLAQARMNELKHRMPAPDFTKLFGRDWNDTVRRIQRVKNLLVTDFEMAIQEYKEVLNDIEIFTNNVDDVTQQFQKTANRITRWLKRQNIKMKPATNHQKELRLKIDNEIRRAISLLDFVMDDLEDKNIDNNSTTDNLYKLTKSLSSIYDTLFKLGEMFNNNIKINRYNNKQLKTQNPISITDIKSLERSAQNLNAVLAKIQSVRKG